MQQWQRLTCLSKQLANAVQRRWSSVLWHATSGGGSRSPINRGKGWLLTSVPSQKILDLLPRNRVLVNSVMLLPSRLLMKLIRSHGGATYLCMLHHPSQIRPLSFLKKLRHCGHLETFSVTLYRTVGYLRQKSDKSDKTGSIERRFDSVCINLCFRATLATTCCDTSLQTWRHIVRNKYSEVTSIVGNKTLSMKCSLLSEIKSCCLPTHPVCWRYKDEMSEYFNNNK